MGAVAKTQTSWGARSDAAAIARLAKAVRQTDPAVVLADPHVVARIIKHDKRMTGLFARVPHQRCYSVARETLAKIVDAAEIHTDDLPGLSAGRQVHNMVIARHRRMTKPPPQYRGVISLPKTWP